MSFEPRMLRALAPLALAGCATTSNLVVVLPDANGHVGSVVVHGEDGALVLDEAYAAAGGGAGASELRAVEVDAQDVSGIFGTALASKPNPREKFTLYFVSDSDTLTGESRVAFEAVIEALGRHAAPEVVVTGHTDTISTASYNEGLALKRAEAVRSLFLQRGLPPESVIAAGRGERELLVPSADEVREARNRRVEITVR